GDRASQHALLSSAGIGPGRVELLSHQAKLLMGWPQNLSEVAGHPRLPAGVLPDALQRDAGVEAGQDHLPGVVVEAIDAEPGDHDRRARAHPWGPPRREVA